MTEENETKKEIDSLNMDVVESEGKAEVLETVDETGRAEANQANPKKKDDFWKDLIQTIILAVLIFLILNTVTSRVKVFNVSMQPTLKQGYLLVVNKLAYKWGSAKRGDIIVFHHAGVESQDYIKRIIGLPGDTVEVSGGVVSVNGAPLTEPYIKEMPQYTLSETVPANKLFVLGDNRNQSDDSHSWGFVDMDWVVGKAVFIYWPLREIRLFSGPDLLQKSAQQRSGIELSQYTGSLP